VVLGGAGGPCVGGGLVAVAERHHVTRVHLPAEAEQLEADGRGDAPGFAVCGDQRGPPLLVSIHHPLDPTCDGRPPMGDADASW
jgi:hypothetical protein